MHEMGIKACYIKPQTKTTISKDFSSKLKNILKRDFNPEKPDAAWCTDITYIWTYTDGFVDLTSIMGSVFKKDHSMGAYKGHESLISIGSHKKSQEAAKCESSAGHT